MSKLRPFRSLRPVTRDCYCGGRSRWLARMRQPRTRARRTAVVVRPVLLFLLLVHPAMSFISLGRGRQPNQQRDSDVYPQFFLSLPSMAGKTVAVTGGSRGLGYVTALSLAKKGARVLLMGRSSTALEDALANISSVATGPAPVTVDCDLLDFASVRTAAAMVRTLTAQSGLDVLCLNAGVMLQPDVASKDGYDITASTNVLSHFLLARELLPVSSPVSTPRPLWRLPLVSVPAPPDHGVPRLALPPSLRRHSSAPPPTRVRRAWSPCRQAQDSVPRRSTRASTLARVVRSAVSARATSGTINRSSPT